MEQITIEVNVPFNGCKRCKMLYIETLTYEVWGDENTLDFFCKNYSTCENAKVIAEMESE